MTETTVERHQALTNKDLWAMYEEVKWCARVHSDSRLRVVSEKLLAEVQRREDLLSSIKEDLPVKAYAILTKLGYQYISEITEMTWEDLNEIHGIGSASIEKITQALARKGLGLKDS